MNKSTFEKAFASERVKNKKSKNAKHIEVENASIVNVMMVMK